MNNMSIKTVRQQVEYVLSVSEEARNSDIFLTKAIWVKFYSSYLRMIEDNWTLPLDYYEQVASPSDIVRARADIQNKEKRFLPTSWEVAKKRQWKEAEYYDYFRRDCPAMG